MTWFVEMITEAIIKIINNFGGAVIEAFNGNLTDLTKPIEYIQSGVIESIQKYIYTLSMTLIVLFAILQIYKLYILNEDGDPEANISGFLIRLSKTIILINFSAVISDLIIEFIGYVKNDIVRVVMQETTNKEFIDETILGLSDLANPFASILLMLAVIVLLVIIFFQNLIRAMQIVFLRMLGPIFALNYLTIEKSLWNKWVQSMMVFHVTYILQIIGINIALFSLVKRTFFDSVIAIGWLLFTASVTKIAKEMGYNPQLGIGNTAGRAASMIITRSAMPR